jgi:hypothetical protein
LFGASAIIGRAVQLQAFDSCELSQLTKELMITIDQESLEDIILHHKLLVGDVVFFEDEDKIRKLIKELEKKTAL